MSDRILVVDDEFAIGFALSEYLSCRGYEVDLAAAAGEATILLNERRYAILITDLSLTGSGGAEGLELAALVRRRHPSIRTVILTAYGSAETEATARRMGVSAFLHKPTPLAEIARILAQVISDEPGSKGPSQRGSSVS